MFFQTGSKLLSFPLLDSALCFFIKTRFRVRNSNFKKIIALSLGSLVQRNKFVKLILVDLGVCFVNQCTQNQGTPWSFLKACLRFGKSSSKIAFTPSLGSLTVSWPNIINLYLTDFGECFANQCTQNQT